MQADDFKNENGRKNEDKLLSVTVLVDGEPNAETYPENKKVHAVIIALLPASEHAHAGGYMLTDSSQVPPKELSADQSLADGGVKDGHILSLTKKDGGGGQQS